MRDKSCLKKMEEKEDDIQLLLHPHFSAISFPILSLKDMISFKKKFDKHTLKAANLFLSAQISALLKWSGYLGSDITGRLSHCPHFLLFVVHGNSTSCFWPSGAVLFASRGCTSALWCIESTTVRASTSEAFVISL